MYKNYAALSGIIGYEIFDKNTMGMSEFMQKLNLKRALEGELARTIMTQKGIESARVHIVFPEKSVFRKTSSFCKILNCVILYFNYETCYDHETQNICSVTNFPCLMEQ